MLIREGRGCRERAERVKRNNSAALGRVLVPPPGIHRTIFLSCFTDVGTPTSWEKLIECCPQALDPRPDGTRRLMMLPLTLPPTNQKTAHELTSPSLNHYCKTFYLTAPPRSEHSFEDISPLCPLLRGKPIKLLFSTLPKTLSPRFNSVLGYKG